MRGARARRALSLSILTARNHREPASRERRTRSQLLLVPQVLLALRVRRRRLHLLRLLFLVLLQTADRSWKITLITSLKLKSIFSADAAVFCCFPQSTGR